jgi:RimJ/RimL family protein N-acetyltransferase
MTLDRNGLGVVIRPIDARDAAALEAFHSRLSPESVYRRYFSPHPRLSASEVVRFTQVDHHDREALVATRGATIIGVARFDRVDRDTAEVAVLVEDAYQGQGVGPSLLAALAVRARGEKITSFVAETLVENARMRHVFANMRWTTEQSFDHDVVEYRFGLGEAPT